MLPEGEKRKMIEPHGGKLVSRLPSGTQVRKVLREGGELPAEFTRPEVAAVLHQAFNQQAAQQGA